MGSLIIFEGGGGGVGVVEDCHVIFAFLRNAGLVADFLITAKHIKQWDTKKKHPKMERYG